MTVPNDAASLGWSPTQGDLAQDQGKVRHYIEPTETSPFPDAHGAFQGGLYNCYLSIPYLMISLRTCVTLQHLSDT